jgi:hypothetical protein
MRYMVTAFALALVFAAAGYAAYAFDADNTAMSSGPHSPAVTTSEHLDRPIKTCSGQEPRFGAQPYFFGFTKPGFCATRVIYANTYGEARECAVALCPDCRIEDITSWYQFSSSLQGPDGKQSFCPK